jgi:hypothetical protein
MRAETEIGVGLDCPKCKHLIDLHGSRGCSADVPGGGPCCCLPMPGELGAGPSLIAVLPSLTEDERFVLTHWSMWGSTGYPVVKRGRKWWVDGIRGCGRCPAAFKTREDAWAQWERYVDVLIGRKAGRI